MLKKAGIVVAGVAATMAAMSPLAFADGLIGIDDNAIQIPIQACNNSVVEGALGILASRQKNDDSHDGKCKQDNSIRNRGGNRHHRHHHHD